MFGAAVCLAQAATSATATIAVATRTVLFTLRYFPLVVGEADPAVVASAFVAGWFGSVEVVTEVVLEDESGVDIEEVPGVVTVVETVVEGEVESLVAGDVVVVLAVVEVEELGGVEAVVVLDGLDEVTASLGWQPAATAANVATATKGMMRFMASPEWGWERVCFRKASCTTHASGSPPENGPAYRRRKTFLPQRARITRAGSG